MIKIKVNYHNNQINDIIISGHSNYDVIGHDIVCASASSIAITTINAILTLDSEALIYNESDGYLEIKVLKHDKYIDTLISNMLNLFKELEKKYKKYINFK
ncbi:MAG: ribosomal-processing cysteine protease Prp [Bacilli bacterium]|nr:ribosomal-processing cysteine protease Prp [Bacilli bacterium]